MLYFLSVKMSSIIYKNIYLYFIAFKIHFSIYSKINFKVKMKFIIPSKNEFYIF